MNSNELREACEAAGLNWEADDADYPDYVSDSMGNTWDCTDPALPAYVAELLVAKVREESWMLFVENDSVCFWNCADRARPQTAIWSYGDDDNTLSAAIIRAAMAVLKGGGE